MAILLGLLLSARGAFATDASIFLSPVTGTYTTGEPFTLTVLAGSGGQSINAIEGKLEFDPREFEVVSTDIASSALASWTQSPSASNDVGELSFGGLLSTSTVLARGEVFRFTVRPLRTGELHIRFASGAAVHAADGTGGNILSSLSGGVYLTLPKEGIPQVAASEGTTGGGEVLGAATGTVITSSSHPDQKAWYSVTTAMLSWDAAIGTIGYRLSFDQNERGDGSKSYPASTREKRIEDLEEGEWYFHLTRDKDDGTRERAHYRIGVDLTPPTPVVASLVPREKESVPRVGVMLFATDTVSGVDHYEFTLDGISAGSWVDDGTHVRYLDSVAIGAHELAISAVDRAGNSSSGSIEFAVEHLATPSLVVLSRSFIEGGKLELDLVSVPNATLEIEIARANSSPVVEEFTLDGSGRGVYTSALPLLPGSYSVSATARTIAGERSRSSDVANFEVSSSFMGVMKRHPMVPVSLIGLALLLVGSIYGYRRFVRSDESVDEEDELDSEDDNEGENDRSPIDRPRARAEGGAVVLAKKERVSPPATRL